MKVAETGSAGASASRKRDRAEILIAEDDPLLASMLEDYLGSLKRTVRATNSPVEAKRWLEDDMGPLVLDGSVFVQMRVPLRKLQGQAIIWSGDLELVEKARQLGLRAFSKEDLDGLARCFEIWPSSSTSDRRSTL